MPGFSGILLLLALGLAFYTLGASMVEGLVNYRTWHLIGAEHFRDYHRAVGPRIVAILVVPFGLSIALTLALTVWRPAGVPLLALLVSLGLDAVAVAATLAWQLPAQKELDRNGWSQAVVDRLIGFDWLRLIPHVLNAALFLWLAGRVVAAATGPAQ